MYREGSSFLKVNGNPINYYTQNCNDKRCIWVGHGSSYDLKIGNNKFNFQVATITSNNYIRAIQRYDFIFNNIKKFEYVSIRKGRILDKVDFSFSLSLKEIDPVLYEDYEKFKEQSLISESELKSLFYEREMAIENLINQYEKDLKYQDNYYDDLLNFEKLEDIDINKLKEKGYSKEYLLGLSSAKQYLQDISEKISFRIQKDFDKKKVETTELLQKLRNYGVEVSDLNVSSDIEGIQSSPLVQKILAKIEDLYLKFEQVFNDKSTDTSLLLNLLNKYKYTFKLTKDIYSQSDDISASDKLEIFRALHKVRTFLKNNKITLDFWPNGKLVSKASRVFVDEQISKGKSDFKEVKKEIIKSSKENFHNRLDNSLISLSRLNAKIKLNELNQKVSVENINFAKNAYKSSVKLLPTAISNKSTDLYDQVDTLTELGEAALDFSTEFIPGASRAKSVYTIVTGKDVFGNQLTDMDMSLEVMTLVLGTKYGAKLASKIIPSSVKKFLASNVSKLVNKTKVFLGVDYIFNSARKWDNVKSLIHTVRGTSKIAADGSYKLVKGLHTKMGLDHFVKMNAKAGKNLTIKNVTKFDKVNPTEHILKETLDNGVTRVQLPRSAFANGDRFRSAYVKTPAGDVHQGAKTLFPDSYSVDEIAKAANHVVEQNKGNVSSLIKGKYKNINVVVQRDKNTGKIISTYPEWIQ